MTSELRFKSRGAQLFGAEVGNGPPIVLLHGGLANHQSTLLFAAPLAERFRIIAPDLRGSGRSIYAGPLDWSILADDVAALVDHLGLDRVVLGGVSLGAGVAVRTALQHPRVVSRLLVLHPAFGGSDFGLTPAQRAAMDAMDAAGSRVVDEGIEALHPLFDAHPPELRARARAVIAGYDPASVATTTRFMRTGGQPFASGADLASIAVPALVIPGTDPTHPQEIANIYGRHLPRCTVRTGDLSAAIADFLAGVDW